ncbi:hypothetical protein TPA0907_48860 [Micromonospora humidisoli]|uniref:MYXO-CTERM domain-containing protein n=1 Tax=Micromonospora humidisoli TaxID=2807622 RepID=A0ABS2JAW3_9ACTN|nr:MULTISPECIES: hypothetical protein [Micromonospora]MBM7083670.1 hypothetical protein [Micromonospora humidisoli]GHJ10519.1 hypothetical protein TPA0907_48860 [Micromonospora sp. AKA109]
MTVDHEMIAEDASNGDRVTPTDEVSTATMVGYAVAGIAVVGWFLFGWLVQRQGFIDSVGEAAGTGFALLLIVSVIGTVRRSRR